MYRYVGLHWLCKLFVGLTLVSATPPVGGHAAAFISAQNHALTRWVQAGVESNGTIRQPYLYVEWRVRGETFLVVIPWSFRERAHGRLERHGQFWRAGVGGLWTPWLRIRHAQRCNGLELYRGAHGKARVGGRTLAG